MNIALDQVLRAVSADEEFRARAAAAPDEVAAAAGIPVADLHAALTGDVVALYERGAHPLLTMAAAAAAGVDPGPRFAAARESPSTAS